MVDVNGDMGDPQDLLKASRVMGLGVSDAYTLVN
jgi:hypothetical protein